MLRQEYGHALIRECATSGEARDRTRDVWKDSDSSERYWVKNTCLIVIHCQWVSMREVSREIGRFELTNKYATAGKNMKEWIEVVRVRPLEKIEEDLRATTGNARENQASG